MENYLKLGVVQWATRPFASGVEFITRIKQHVRSLKSYGVDFVLFPEYFSLGIVTSPGLTDPREMIRELGGLADGIARQLSALAVENELDIIAGSIPFLAVDGVYNRCYFLRRDGRIQHYDKIHLTPFEREEWELSPGSEAKVFDTPFGQAAILICYDAEFPELARKMALSGARLFFVPFQTDRYGYQRVRYCAHARAIENECFVAIAGNVSSVPIPLLGYQYAQSAVVTPSDYGFPERAIRAQAEANQPDVLVTELDFNLLRRLPCNGAVRPLDDRRTDLY